MISSSTPVAAAATDLILTTLYLVHQRYPQLLTEACRHWLQKTSSEAQRQKILHLFSQATDSAATLRAADQVIKKLFVPAFKGSKPHAQLLSALQKRIDSPAQPNRGCAADSEQVAFPERLSSYAENHDNSQSFGLLLIDAENINLAESVEKQLVELATYPVRYRLAFGNWRQMGNRDQDFYRRGYQMVHVPSGKNSADIKMSLDVSLISLYNPAIREVFICSTDRDLLHLGHTLMKLGITPYQVRLQKRHIVVDNLAEQTSYTVVLPEQADNTADAAVKIPTLAQMKSWLKTLVKQAQQEQPEQPVTIGHLGKLFRDRNQISPSQVLKAHGGYKTLTEFLSAHDAFVLTPLPNSSQVMVTLSAPADPLDTANTKNFEVRPDQPVAITNPKRLEQALITGIQILSSEATGEYIGLSDLCSHFASVHREPITQVLRRIGEPKKLPKFLAKCPTIQSCRHGKDWKVALASQTHADQS